VVGKESAEKCEEGQEEACRDDAGVKESHPETPKQIPVKSTSERDQRGYLESPPKTANLETLLGP